MIQKTDKVKGLVHKTRLRSLSLITPCNLHIYMLSQSRSFFPWNSFFVLSIFLEKTPNYFLTVT
ncbi:hypothetical protein HanPSC8_Chr01g0009611 [Helianthus annuus]|nr:hypothetical protein HanPSC8_Chr01g0009611 [Helianthus annuus]